MKKHKETKKVIIAALILAIAIFVFPLSSFGEGEDGCIIRNEGDIEGLVFPLGGLALDIPVKNLMGQDGDTITINVSFVVVYAGGKEVGTLTPAGQFIYEARLPRVWQGGVLDPELPPPLPNLRIIHAITPDENVWTFAFRRAKLFEYFIDDEQIPSDLCSLDDPLGRIYVPLDAVDLFFMVRKARLILVNGIPPKKNQPKFDLTLKIEQGDLESVEVLSPPLTAP